MGSRSACIRVRLVFKGGLYLRVGFDQGNTVVSENNPSPSTKIELKVHLAFEEVIRKRVAISKNY